MTNDQLDAGTTPGRARRVLTAVTRTLSATHPCAFAPWTVGVTAWPTCETSPGLHAQLHAAVFGPGLVGDQLGAGTTPTDTAPTGAGTNTGTEGDRS